MLHSCIWSWRKKDEVLCCYNSSINLFQYSQSTHTKAKKPLKRRWFMNLYNPRSQSICNEVKRKRKKSRQVWQNTWSMAITDIPGLKAFSSLTKTCNSDKHWLMSERHILDCTCLCIFTCPKSTGGGSVLTNTSCLVTVSHSSFWLAFSSVTPYKFTLRWQCLFLEWSSCQNVPIFWEQNVVVH